MSQCGRGRGWVALPPGDSDERGLWDVRQNRVVPLILGEGEA
jgi:hypothetical protein